MESIGAFEAKGHLARLLDASLRARPLRITRHGEPAAMLVSVRPAAGSLSHAEIVDGIRELRRRVTSGGITVGQRAHSARRLDRARLLFYGG